MLLIETGFGPRIADPLQHGLRRFANRRRRAQVKGHPADLGLVRDIPGEDLQRDRRRQVRRKARGRVGIGREKEMARLQGLQGRPESLPEPAWTDLGSHAGTLHREPPVENSYWSEVMWVPCSGTTRPD